MLIYSDGGARGNPGPAAIAFIIQSETGATLRKDASYIGFCTNNQAEYKALFAALESAAELKPDSITCYSDSELIVKQLNGKYSVKNKELKELWLRVQEARKQFHEAKFVNVTRSHPMISEADKLVNLTLDERIEPRQSRLNKH